MSATPDWVGQVYKDTGTGNIWKSNSTTPGDWSLDVQNLELTWEPKNLKLLSVAGLSIANDVAGLTKVSFLAEHSVMGVYVINQTSLLELHFPNLIDIDAAGLVSGSFSVQNCSALTTVSLPVLATGSGALLAQTAIISCPLLTSIDLSSLQTLNGDLNLNDDTTLANLSLPSLVSAKDIKAQNCALSQASVDGLLAKLVSIPVWGLFGDKLWVDGGTNSPPSSVGPGSDYATLTARGAWLLTN